MDRLNISNVAGGENGVSQGKTERILFLFGTAVKDLRVITDSFDSVTKTVYRSKTTETDNAVKICKAEMEAKKEDNRHDEAMANIELEYKKIANAAENGELRWSMIQTMVQILVAESNKINTMDNLAFLTEESRASRDDLHRTMLELSKEIIKA